MYVSFDNDSCFDNAVAFAEINYVAIKKSTD